ncbi:MAG: hypothetical protein GXY83_19140 [Rhodopirellula sp.]|nr:hypothetical protein [Rhodopirellula sp.]
MKFLACRTILALGLLAIGSMTKGDAPPHVVSDVQVVLHRDYATTAAFTPDGKRLFVSTDDGIFVWDIAAQRKTADWLKPSEGRQNIVISPDGQCLVTGGDDRIAAWDLATARQFTELRERFSSGGNLLKLAFAPRGQTVAAGNEDGSLFLWDVTPEKPARPIAPDARLGESRLRVKDLAFFPDGRTLLVAGEQRVSFWDMEPGRFRDYQVRCPYHIGGIALSPDGKTLVAAPGETLLAGGIDFWDPSTGKLTRRFQRYVDYRAAAFSPDGRWLATSDQGDVDLWDLSTGVKRVVLTSDRQTASYVHRLLFSSDSGNVCAVGSDSVRLWILPQLPEVPSPETSHRSFVAARAAIRGLVFDADGTTLLIASSDGKCGCWKAATGELLEAAFPDLGEPAGIAISPNAAEVATWGRRGGRAVVQVWDRKAGALRFSLPRPANEVLSAAFRPDGQQLAFSTDEGEIALLDMVTGKPAVTLQSQGSEIWAVAFSPNGELLASAGGRLGRSEGSLSLWDLKRSVRVGDLAGHAGPVFCTAFSQSGEYLFSAGAEGLIRVWDVARRDLRVDLERHRRAVFALAVRSDGLQLASAGADHVIRLWALDRIAPPTLLSGNHDQVESLAYSPDGKLLASGNADGAVKIWELPQ